VTTLKTIRHEIRSAFYRMRGHYRVRMDRETFTCDPENWRFWRHVSTGRWEPHTLKILRTVLSKNDEYLDVGSWIGPTALYASRFCKTVYCLEPDPVAYELLLKNIRLNKVHNIRTLQLALYHEKARLRLGSPQGLGTSGSSLLFGGTAGAAPIQCVPLDEALEIWNLARLQLIKIDIEGGEFDILPKILGTLAASSDAVLLSTHAPHFPAADRLSKMKLLRGFFDHFPVVYDDRLHVLSPADVERDAYVNRYSEFLCSKRPIPNLLDG
jgi:FkbM family methyltransferase